MLSILACREDWLRTEAYDRYAPSVGFPVASVPVARTSSESEIELHADIERIATSCKLSLPALSQASSLTQQRLQRFATLLQKEVDPGDTGGKDVALTGSFAREELTNESDCDYLIVIDGEASHTSIRNLVVAVNRVRSDMRLGTPGTTGTFGDFVTSIELYSRIGLDSDSNINTTRRVLLLFESVSVLNATSLNAVRRKILDRYLLDYAPNANRVKPVRVPHFLLNDLVRYWRTIAVDFGAKQWRSLSQDWYLRYAKLLTTRKVMFAGSLASLLRVQAVLTPLQGSDPSSWDREAIYEALVNYLESELTKPPLARLCGTYDELHPEGQEALCKLLTAYDLFISLVNDPEARHALSREGAKYAEEFIEQVEAIGDTVHESLTCVFFDSPCFATANRIFSLF